MRSVWGVTKASESSHLLLDGGILFVPEADAEAFIREYVLCVDTGAPLFVVEKRTPVFRMHFDFDYKVISDGPAELSRIAAIAKRGVGSCLADPELAETACECVREERDGKTGMHLIFPDVRVDAATALVMRDVVIRELTESDEPERPMDNLWCAVVDECVFRANGLRMVFSSKCERCKPCKGVGCDACKKGKVFLGREYVLPGKTTEEAVRLTSIRTYLPATELNDDTLSAIEDAAKPDVPVISCYAGFTNDASDLAFFKRLVLECLSNDRADDYMKWSRLAWDLANISPTLQPTFVEFSRRSAKFDEGSVDKYFQSSYKYSKDGKSGQGSLIYWAKEDNPKRFGELFAEHRSARQRECMFSARAPTHALGAQRDLEDRKTKYHTTFDDMTVKKKFARKYDDRKFSS